MSTYLMDPIGVVGSETQCPGCGSRFTAWVNDGELDNLFCKTCGSCWHETARVDVSECPGCQFQDVCRVAAG